MSEETRKGMNWKRFRKGPHFARRFGRALFWSHPELYRWLGRTRGRGDCLDEDFDLWIDGYPRSANSFAVESFRIANPNARIRSHRHIPTFILNALECNKPGIFLLRKPEDAVVSWAIFWDAELGQCLDYYIDFHRPLGARAAELFVASFDVVIRDFNEVIRQFNGRFGTEYATAPNGLPTRDLCFSAIEDSAFRHPEGGVNELRVSRPSRHREELKPRLTERLHKSPVLRRKLEEANQLHAAFAPISAPAKAPVRTVVRKPGNTQPLPALG